MVLLMFVMVLVAVGPRKNLDDYEDSAIGAYGAIGLILLLLLKYQGLTQLIAVPEKYFYNL
jgi:cobalamin synthase